MSQEELHDTVQPEVQDEADARPDPSDVESLQAEQYKHQRDDQGELIPEDDVVRVGGEWKGVERKPMTKGFLTRIEADLQSAGDQFAFDQFDEYMCEFWVNPDVAEPEDWEDYDPRLYVALFMRMMDLVVNHIEDDDVAGDMMELADQRASEMGNTTR